MIGAQLGDFLLERLEKSDPAGQLFRARQLSLERTVALELYGPGAASLERLQRLAALAHPCLAPIYAVGEAAGRCYLAFRWIEGQQDLAQALSQGLGTGAALRALGGVAAGLAMVHGAGLAHGRLSAACILLDPSGPLLAGFRPDGAPTPGDDLSALALLLAALPAADDGPLAELIALARDAGTDAGLLADALHRAADALGAPSQQSLAPRSATALEFEPPAPAPTAELPLEFSKYQLLGKLGHGGMGIVYRALQPELGREVALKVLRAEGAPSPELRERFVREARAAAKLRHPGIVAIHEVGEAQQIPFFTMDLVDGQPLSEMIAQEGHLPLRRALELVRDVSLAVAHAHDQGVIHRDLKPSNILVDESGRALVTDFGLAKLYLEDADGAPADLTESGAICGTPSYMSPEQARGWSRHVEPRSDVFSLGAVLYHALTGQPPFVGESTLQVVMAVVEEDPIPPRQLRPPIGADAETICLKALAKTPEQRYDSARALAEDLQRLLDDEPILARPPSLAYRLGRWAVRRRVALAAALASALLVAAGAWGVAELMRRRAARTRQADLRGQLDRAGALLAETRRWQEVPLERFEEQVTRLLRLRSPELIRLLLRPEHLSSAHPWERRLAIEAIGRIGHMKGVDAVGPLCAALERTDPRTHIETAVALARALGRLADPRAHEVMRRQLKRAGPGSPFWLRAQRFLQQIPLPGGAPDGAQPDAEALNRRGVALVNKGELAGALRDFSAAIRLDAAFAEAWANRARLYLQQRKLDLARSDIDRALKLAPHSALALATRGVIRAELGDRTGALGDFDLSLEVEPDQPLTLLKRGHLLLELKRYADAIADYDRAIRLEPMNPGNYFSRGVAEQQAGRLLKALASYDRAIRLDQGQRGLFFYHRGVAYRTLGKRAAAIADMTRAIERGFRAQEVYTDRGILRLRSGDATGARDDFTEALRRNPWDANLHFNLGNALSWQKAWAAAIASYGRAIKIRPGMVAAYINRGLAHRMLGNLTAARADLEEATRRGPDHANAHTMLALVLLQSGDRPGALAAAERGVKLAPKSANAHYQRGLVHRALGERAKELADYDAAIRLDPRHRKALFKRAFAHAAAGRHAKAAADYSAVITLDPRNGKAWFNRSHLRRKLGDLPGAASDAAQAVRVAPGMYAAWWNHADHLRRTGKLKQALEAYRKAHALAPASRKATLARIIRQLGG